MNEPNIKVQYVSINDLLPAAHNPRVQSPEAMTGLKESIKRYGLVDPIIVNGAGPRRNIVIGGHMRLRAAKDLGHKEMPVVYVHLPDIEKEKELNIRLNKNTGDWDWELLAKFDESFLADIDFSSEDLDHFFAVDNTPQTFDLKKSAREH